MEISIKRKGKNEKKVYIDEMKKAFNVVITVLNKIISWSYPRCWI